MLPWPGLAVTEAPSNAISFEVEEGNDLFWESIYSKRSVTATLPQMLHALHPCRNTQDLPPCLCPASTAAALLRGVGVSSPSPRLLEAGSVHPRLDRSVVLLPHHPQVSMWWWQGWCQGCSGTSTKAPLMLGAVPAFHRPPKTVKLVLLQSAVSSGCAPGWDQCLWSTSTDASL